MEHQEGRTPPKCVENKRGRDALRANVDASPPSSSSKRAISPCLPSFCPPTPALLNPLTHAALPQALLLTPAAPSLRLPDGLSARGASSGHLRFLGGKSPRPCDRAWLA